MTCAPRGVAGAVCRECIVALAWREKAISCVLANRTTVLLPLLFASHIAIGDEVTFPLPAENAVGAEVYLTKPSVLGTRNGLYLVPIEHATQPQLDKRDQSFVLAQVRGGNLGICSV